MPQGMFKICTRCKQEKPLSDFSRDGHSKRSSYGKPISSCKSCENKRTREYMKKNKDKQTHKRLLRFGLTLETYNRIFESQKGLCAVCEKPEKAKHQNGFTKLLAIDHDHQNGKIRGLLCFDCNTGIGKLGDSIDGLTRALEYLRQGE